VKKLTPIIATCLLGACVPHQTLVCDDDAPFIGKHGVVEDSCYVSPVSVERWIPDGGHADTPAEAPTAAPSPAPGPIGVEAPAPAPDPEPEAPAPGPEQPDKGEHEGGKDHGHGHGHDKGEKGERK
jgi:hypothetical protein